MAYIFTSPVISTESPLVSSDIFFNNINPYLKPKPVTLNLDYSVPLVSTYETIDDDPNMRNKMVEYFYDLIRDKWLLDDINDILNYFKYEGGEVKLSEYSKNNINKDTNDTAEKKVKFITKNILDRHVIQKILHKFTNKTRTKWVELPRNEYFLMKFTKEYIIKLINKQLKK